MVFREEGDGWLQKRVSATAVRSLHWCAAANNQASEGMSYGSIGHWFFLCIHSLLCERSSQFVQHLKIWWLSFVWQVRRTKTVVVKAPESGLLISNSRQTDFPSPLLDTASSSPGDSSDGSSSSEDGSSDVERISDLEVDESALEFEALGIINTADEVCKTQNSKPRSLLSLGHHPLSYFPKIFGVKHVYFSLSGNALNEMSIYGKSLDSSWVPNLKTWNHVLTQEFQRSHRINDVTRSGFRV